MSVKELWARWKKVARKIADFQGRVLLSVFYFLILGPIAILVNLRKDVLSQRHGAFPAWRQTKQDDLNLLEKSSRQS
jgi:hypothetical protein